MPRIQTWGWMHFSQANCSVQFLLSHVPMVASRTTLANTNSSQGIPCLLATVMRKAQRIKSVWRSMSRIQSCQADGPRGCWRKWLQMMKQGIWRQLGVSSSPTSYSNGEQFKKTMGKEIVSKTEGGFWCHQRVGDTGNDYESRIEIQEPKKRENLVWKLCNQDENLGRYWLSNCCRWKGVRLGTFLLWSIFCLMHTYRIFGFISKHARCRGEASRIAGQTRKLQGTFSRGVGEGRHGQAKRTS